MDNNGPGVFSRQSDPTRASETCGWSIRLAEPVNQPKERDRPEE